MSTRSCPTDRSCLVAVSDFCLRKNKIKGYADVVYLPTPKYSEKPALLLEFKYGKNMDAAMDQIRRQKYLDWFEHYKGNTLVIGINYDRDVPSGHPEFFTVHIPYSDS